MEHGFSTKVDREGVFKARFKSWSMLKSKSTQSQAIKYHFEIISQWSDSDSTWVAWPEGFHSEKAAWVIGKNNTLNDKAVSAMAELGLWPESFAATELEPPVEMRRPFIVTIEKSEYNGYTNFDISWINPDAAAPRKGKGGGGATPPDPDSLKALDAQFGSAVRALTGGATPAAAPPAAPVVPLVDDPSIPF